MDTNQPNNVMHYHDICPITGNTYLITTISELIIEDQLDDRANAASDVLVLLKGEYEHERAATLSADQHYPMPGIRRYRPRVLRDDDRPPALQGPASFGLDLIRFEDEGVNLILARLIEPMLNWRDFCRTLTDVAEHFQCVEVINLVAHEQRVPYDQPTPLTLGFGSYDRADELGIPASESEDETGTGGLLGDFCTQSGMPFIRLRAGLPSYVAEFASETFQFEYPGVTLALLGALEQITSVHFPAIRALLERWQDDWLEEVASYIQQNPETAEIHELRTARYDAALKQERAEQEPLDVGNVLPEVNRILGLSRDD
jgi:hypothetical protein